ncbi:hypothetical protein ACWF82_32390 [Nocardia sp. NPDC055053]
MTIPRSFLRGFVGVVVVGHMIGFRAYHLANTLHNLQVQAERWRSIEAERTELCLLVGAPEAAVQARLEAIQAHNDLVDEIARIRRTSLTAKIFRVWGSARLPERLSADLPAGRPVRAEVS